jgi:hypothetical protein
MKPAMESRCYKELETDGALIRIKSPSLMGKTSLMARLLERATLLGQRVVRLNLRQLNQSHLGDIQLFLQWLCTSIDRKLALNYKPQLDEIMYSPNDNATQFIERVLEGTSSSEPIVLAIDDFDRIFSFEAIRIDVCGLLRGWFENGKTSTLWSRLRMIITYSQDSYLDIDINWSPFNVGFPVKLDAFPPEQTNMLIDRHKIHWTADHRERFVELVAGHPYLLRLGLHELACGSIDQRCLLSSAATDGGVFSRHLQQMILPVEQQPDLREALSEVVRSTEPLRINQAAAFKLESLGLVIRVGQGMSPRCDLYRQYVLNRWEI